MGGSPSIAIGDTAGSGGTPGVGAIDATGLPTQLPIDCPGTTSGTPPPPQLALPRKIGEPIGDNVLECYDLAGRTALQSFIPFGKLQSMLNQPVQFPFAALPSPPGSDILKLTGTAVFTQVDPVGRAFVARLIGGEITWTGPNGETLACPVPDTPFWAVAGNFK